MPVLLISGDAPVGRGVANALGPDLKSFPAAAVTRACGIPTFAPSSTEAARQALAAELAPAGFEAWSCRCTSSGVSLEGL